MPDGYPRLHLGGPDRPHRHLRNLLRQKIDAVPSGGQIIWSTYYFRDGDLAEALIAAAERGVTICLHVEGAPRRKTANAAVIARLSGHGLDGGVHVHAAMGGPLGKFHPHLHAKIYCFSHPEPVALIGSFNPSGDQPEDADVVAEIGDQDRGHNILIEFADPVLVDALCGHVSGMGRHLFRFRPSQNRAVASVGTVLRFYPRLRTNVIGRGLRDLRAGDRLRGAISHLKRGELTEALARGARAGASVRLIVHDTERRVPEAAIAMLAGAGVDIVRYRHPEALPLHAKFLLVARAGMETAWFGSFNYNPRSRWLNRELLAESRDPAIVEPLGQRFEAIAAEIASMRDRERISLM